MTKRGKQSEEDESSSDPPPIEMERQRATVRISTLAQWVGSLVLAVAGGLAGAFAAYYSLEARVKAVEERCRVVENWLKDPNAFPGMRHGPLPPIASVTPVPATMNTVTDNQGRPIVDDRTGNVLQSPARSGTEGNK